MKLLVESSEGESRSAEEPPEAAGTSQQSFFAGMPLDIS